DEVERLDVGARRDFRHHAAERGMRLDLREHDVCENPARPKRQPLDHRRAGLVAGCLNAEHQHSTLRSIAPQTQSAFSARSLCSLPALGLLPPPFTGEGWGGGGRGGGIQQDSCVRAPSLALPRKRGRGRTECAARLAASSAGISPISLLRHPRYRVSPAATGLAPRGHRVQSAKPTPSFPLVIGTRGSPLALAQAQLVRERLAAAHALAADAITLEAIHTTGDRIRD